MTTDLVADSDARLTRSTEEAGRSEDRVRRASESATRSVVMQ